MYLFPLSCVLQRATDGGWWGGSDSAHAGAGATAPASIPPKLATPLAHIVPAVLASVPWPGHRHRSTVRRRGSSDHKNPAGIHRVFADVFQTWF